MNEADRHPDEFAHLAPSADGVRRTIAKCEADLSSPSLTGEDRDLVEYDMITARALLARLEAK